MASKDTNIQDFVVQFDIRLIDAAEAINNNKCRTIFVEKNNRLVGVLSEGDILRCLLQGVEIHAPIKSYMHQSFMHVSKIDWPHITNLFKKHNISLLPVVDEDMKLQRVITLQDVLEQLTTES
jgi:predicted transcriptional regulator